MCMKKATIYIAHKNTLLLFFKKQSIVRQACFKTIPIRQAIFQRVEKLSNIL